ncbi:MAG: hypothetical protein AAB663_01525 [Patescibacteria group bacterium]
MTNVFHVTVDYSRTPEQMMEAAGCKKAFPTELFPNKSGVEEIEIIFMQFNVRATLPMIRAKMRTYKRRGCNVAELLALVEACRSTVGTDKIVALGSWDSREDGTQGFPAFDTSYFEMICDAQEDYDALTANQRFFSAQPGFNESYRYAMVQK